MDTSKYLPLGTVVKLENATKEIMITGYKLKNKNTGKEFDYMGCPFPQGFNGDGKIAMFDHSQVRDIYHFGLKDEESKELIDMLKSL